MKSKQPFFSVVTCTRNSEKYIDRNLRSVAAQIFKNYEHVIIDGYSTDKTLTKIGRIKKYQRNRVKVFERKPNGVNDAFNQGIKKSRGKYLIYLNSDDYFHDKNVLADVYNYLLRNPDYDWIYGKILLRDKSEKILGHFPTLRVFKKPNPDLLRLTNYIPHQAVFIKKSVFRKYGGFNKKVPWLFDYEYSLRISSKTKWAYFDRFIANFSVWLGSSSFDKENRERVEKVVLKFHKHRANFLEHLIFWLLNYSPMMKAYQRFKKLRY